MDDMWDGTPGGIRTHDPGIRKPVLYGCKSLKVSELRTGVVGHQGYTKVDGACDCVQSRAFAPMGPWSPYAIVWQGSANAIKRERVTSPPREDRASRFAPCAC